jgi:hypothetical protein
MPRYRVTRTERTFHDVDCANPEQALEIAHSGDLPERDWRPAGDDDATTFAVSELGAGETDAEAHHEALAALASMSTTGGTR